MNTMPGEHEKIPLDARLLSDAIIELNISRRNVSIYPRGHPSVEKSMKKDSGKAFNPMLLDKFVIAMHKALAG